MKEICFRGLCFLTCGCSFTIWFSPRRFSRSHIKTGNKIATSTYKLFLANLFIYFIVNRHPPARPDDIGRTGMTQSGRNNHNFCFLREKIAGLGTLQTKRIFSKSIQITNSQRNLLGFSMRDLCFFVVPWAGWICNAAMPPLGKPLQKNFPYIRTKIFSKSSLSWTEKHFFINQAQPALA